MEKVPKYLYRGIKVGIDDIFNFDFKGDITPYGEPSLNEIGLETISDGNEYDIYMSDNKNMPLDVYGNPDIHDGKLVLNILNDVFLLYPDVGIVYKIDTNNISFHRPWITDYLKGVYNNGYLGDEYVTDFIPKDSYEIIRIKVGEDFLHKAKVIDISSLDLGISNMKLEVKRREEDINNFVDYVKSMPYGNKTVLSMYKDLMRYLFGDNGVIKRDDFDLDNPEDALASLVKKEFNKDMYNFRDLKYIMSLKDDLNDSLEDVIIDRIIQNENDKNDYLASHAGEDVDTFYFDKNNDFLNGLLDDIKKDKIR